MYDNINYIYFTNLITDCVFSTIKSEPISTEKEWSVPVESERLMKSKEKTKWVRMWSETVYHGVFEEFSSLV